MSQTENNPFKDFFDGMEKSAKGYADMVLVFKQQATPEVMSKLDPETRAKMEKDLADLTKKTSEISDLIPAIQKAQRDASNLHNNNL